MTDKELQEILFKYKAALKVVETKIEIMYNELKQSDDYNCIEHIKTRLKKPDSIYNKLEKYGYEITKENIESKIHDIAGIRIICSFLKDVEKVTQLIQNDNEIMITQIKDYIKNPKSSGYSSLHIIAKVPVNLLNKKEYVDVEIQIRTIAMDMWASLEHKLLYKNKKGLSKESEKFITSFSHTSQAIDNIMEEMIIESTKYNQKEEKDNEYSKELQIIKQTPMLKYELARKQLQEKLENIYYELSQTMEINPIEHIKTRIKEPKRVVNKLEKLNYEITPENMNDHIHDLVGARIICSFLSDLEQIKNIIEQDGTIQIIKRKNYIDNPKPNGYRSYHYNVLVPVKMINKIEYVEAEIQIRTIAMDMWASLEHKICYRRDGNIPEIMKEKLKNISDKVNQIDIILDESINREKTNNHNKLLLKQKRRN